MRILLTSLAGLLGLAFGSFLNVCLSRWPSGESVVRPSSHCRACGRTLSWWENVPVVSWIALRGRCRSCGVWIGWRHPVVELAVAVIWSLQAVKFLGMLEHIGPRSPFDLYTPIAESILQMAFVWILVALAVLDMEHMWLPNKLTIPWTVLGFTAWMIVLRVQAPATLEFYGASSMLGRFLLDAAWKRLVAIAIPALLILFIRWTYWLVRRREGMGLGDAKLMAMLGAWLGLEGALLSFAIGVLLGALIGLLVLIRGGRGNLTQSTQTKMPLGTFLCIGGIISALWGQPIIAAYLHFIGL